MRNNEESKALNSLDQEVYNLYDEYVHSDMSRRKFMSRISIYASTALTAAAITEFMLPEYAEATQIHNL